MARKTRNKTKASKRMTANQTAYANEFSKLRRRLNSNIRKSTKAGFDVIKTADEFLADKGISKTKARVTKKDIALLKSIKGSAMNEFAIKTENGKHITRTEDISNIRRKSGAKGIETQARKRKEKKKGKIIKLPDMFGGGEMHSGDVIANTGMFQTAESFISALDFYSMMSQKSLKAKKATMGWDAVENEFLNLVHKYGDDAVADGIATLNAQGIPTSVEELLYLSEMSTSWLAMLAELVGDQKDVEDMREVCDNYLDMAEASQNIQYYHKNYDYGDDYF